MKFVVVWWWGVWQLIALQSYSSMAITTPAAINRQHQGDMFSTSDHVCSSEVCVGRSSGTAMVLPQTSPTQCHCQCLQHVPVYRDDLQICVDDIHECPLATFLSGTTSQKIPFVFLPLKGQIVYPSAEISFTGSKSPICVVSGAKFLSRGGWSNLRNHTDAEAPFRLFRDEGRTFLQIPPIMVTWLPKCTSGNYNNWLGDPDLRLNMEGRLLLVHLMCKDMDENTNIFTPCVAFRVAGSPSHSVVQTHERDRVREVSFSADAQATEDINNSTGLSASEYIAIGICSILLGLIYVASVLLFLHTRRRQNKSRNSSAEEGHSSVGHLGGEEGVIKNNPLLRHCHENGGYISDSPSCCSEAEEGSDIAAISDEGSCKLTQNVQVTCAMIHPCSVIEALSMSEPLHQESNIERLPEENVSIIETLENREDGPENVRAITAASTRRKLYFNPAYFELEMLLAPPPAALEFLTKIREVIAIAKHKMASKRFLPSLIGIPEENEHITRGSQSIHSGSILSLKQEKIKHRNCEGCPGCNSIPHTHQNHEGSSCKSCCTVENKQRSIQKWLEDVPLVKSNNEVAKQRKHNQTKGKAPCIPSEKVVKTKVIDEITMENNNNICNEKKKTNPFIIEEKLKQTDNKLIENNNSINTNNEQKYSKLISEKEEEFSSLQYHQNIENRINKKISNDLLDYNGDLHINKVPSPPPPAPPSSICSSLERENCQQQFIEKPVVAKHLMDEVIKELVGHRALDTKLNNKEPFKLDSQEINEDSLPSVHYDTDSLERSHQNEEIDGMRTPSDYGDLDRCTSNLLDQEVTMRNSMNGNMMIPKSKEKENDIVDDHEYEVILLNPSSNKTKFVLPDILSRGEGYSLVSEVYVNDAYSFSSSSSLPSNASSCASLTNEPKIKYVEEKPGQLTIEVEDSPSNYERTYDSDSFEPDTLDRKPSKFKINSEGQFEFQICKDDFTDSLERPPQISLRTTGSFRSDSLCWYDSSNVMSSPLHRTYGSLREIFEAKNKYHRGGSNRSETLSPVGSTRSLDTDCYSTLSWKRGKPKLLRPEAKQARRQRQPSPPPPRPPKINNKNDLITSKKPSSSLLISRDCKPPLPPKNGSVRSISQRNVAAPTSFLMTRGVLSSASGLSLPSSDYEAIQNQSEELSRRLKFSLNKEIRGGNNAVNPREKRNPEIQKQQPRFLKVTHRTEDSGYLSSDSNGSDGQRREESLSETDDSLCDGASESGAESIATDSFFFGNFHKFSMANSVDSGVGAASVHSDSDSNISFVTVLPTDFSRRNEFFVQS